jgi:hypothetical protein
MADISSAPLFPHLVDQTGTDPIIHRGGADQFLGDIANHHDDQPTVGPRGNRVQDGALSLITNSSSPFGSPTKAQPLGRQTL